MLRTIIDKEIRDLIGSTKFITTFSVCALLILLAFYVGAARHNLYQSYYQASLEENLRSMEGITDWFDLDQTRIFLPPEPLASLVSGVSNDINRTALIKGRGDVPTEDSRYNEDPVYAIFRFIDLEFIFKVILSLFAILLGYDAICGEKERGTLRLAFANAVPRGTFILGKIIGSFLALTVSISAAMALGLLILPLLGITLSGGEWVRLLLILLTGLLYFGAFLALSVFLSSLTFRSANSFLLALVVWVMCIHIIPGTSVLLAARSVDVPSSDEIAYKKSSLGAQLSEEFNQALDLFEPDENAEGPESIVQELNSYMDSLMEIRDEKLLSLSRQLGEERQNRQRAQEKYAFTLARISPATSLSLAASHLSGTSLSLKDRFDRQARDYQEAFGKFMKEKTGMNPGGMIRIRKTIIDGESEAVKPETINPRELPTTNPIRLSLAEAIYPALKDIGLLILYNFLFFAGAFIAFLRYDVR